MKKTLVMALCLCFAFASSGYTGHCTTRTKRSIKRTHAGKFCTNMKLLRKNADTLDLSVSQREEIRQLKYEAKKNKIKAWSDIKLAKVELSQALKDSDSTLEDLNTLIDEKYRLKAEREKEELRTYTALNDLLSAEQKETLCTLRRQRRKKSYKVDKRSR